MLIKQISVFLENKAGKLSDVINTIGENGIDIYALSIADTTDYGIIRLIVNDPEKAREVLSEQGMIVKRTEVLGVIIEDKPGGLVNVLDVLTKNDIGIEYIYAFIGKNEKGATVVMKPDMMEEAQKLLSSNGFEIVSGEELYK